jgi:hypothetical protein
MKVSREVKTGIDDRVAAEQARKDGTEYTDRYSFTWLTLKVTDSNPAVTVRLNVDSLVDMIGHAVSADTRKDIAEKLADW